MKIILLAAGKGTRLYPLTKNTPKPLIEIGNGLSLLETQLNRIIESKVFDEVVIVTGYLSEQIEAKIQIYKTNGLSINIVYNPFFDISNNLYSLWFAKHDMVDDFVISNGDNLFDVSIYEDLVTNNVEEGIYLTINKEQEYDEDDMKVIIQNNKVLKVSKQIKACDANAESVGLVMVKGTKFCQIYANNLEKMVKSGEFQNKFWLETFNTLISNGLVVHPFEIDGSNKWQEVDFHLDINKARELLRINR